MKVFKYIVLFSSLLFSLSLNAQPTKVRGKVTDAATKEPIPFATVVFKGTTEGASTDFDGNYFMETRQNVDSIEVSYIGYDMQTLPVNKHSFKTINVALKENVAMLEEVVVTFDKKKENPAHRILRGIIANKKQNNPQKSNSYSYDGYTKMEMSLTNIDEKFKKKKMLKHFQFVFDYVDTSAVTGKAYLPFLITETMSKIYHTNKPKMTREVVEASKVSGFDNNNTSIAQFTGRLQQDVNVYDNYIDLFGQGFISPINDNALLFYKFYLTDSTQYKGKYCYHLSFKPKNAEDATFTGDFWVTAEDFAIADVKMRVTNKVNVNWINDVMIEDEFQLLRDSIWFWKKHEMHVDFTLSEKDSTKSKGFLGRRTVYYDNVKFGQQKDDSFNLVSSKIEVKDDAFERDSAYWSKNRPYALSKSEQGVYQMVDSIKNVPLYRNIVDVLRTIFTGYYRAGKVDLGPYFKMFSHNTIEGARFQFGARTNKHFSEKLQLSGHLAYGVKDKEFKYKFGVLYKLKPRNKLWEAVGASYRHDMEQLGKSSSRFFSSGNILSTALNNGSSDKLTMLNELSLHYEKEWIENFSNKITWRYQELIPSPFVRFAPVGKPETVVGNPIKTHEVRLNTRWAPHEKFIRRTFKKTHIKSKHPIFNFDVALAFGDYQYQKLDFSLEHTVPVYPIGHLYYYAKAGKVFGKAPFPLLHLHEGNETYVYDRHAFNMMKYYEFASDTYGSLFVEHHFMGFLFNKVPLLKKLRWRAVASGKMLWGRLSDKNNTRLSNASSNLLIFPKGLSDLEKPYFEAGVGIENILKVIRVDAVWRLSHTEEERKVDKFGIRATLKLTF